MKKHIMKDLKRLSRTIKNTNKRRQSAINQLQTQAVVISSEEYFERSREARSIVARGFLQNEDGQASHVNQENDK
ncbi:14715_t:CDS:2, partial [Acaulospora colombiana]